MLSIDAIYQEYPQCKFQANTIPKLVFINLYLQTRNCVVTHAQKLRSHVE